jgi:hypothetical protein
MAPVVVQQHQPNGGQPRIAPEAVLLAVLDTAKNIARVCSSTALILHETDSALRIAALVKNVRWPTRAWREPGVGRTMCHPTRSTVDEMSVGQINHLVQLTNTRILSCSAPHCSRVCRAVPRVPRRAAAIRAQRSSSLLRMASSKPVFIYASICPFAHRSWLVSVSPGSTA